MNYSMTASGKFLSLDNPQLDEISIEDIAEGLSKACRFAGQIKGVFYSVAQHSVHVSYFVPPKDALWALLHDSAEAYLCDIPGQVKPGLPNYCDLERRVLDAIALKFGLSSGIPESVKDADERMLMTEAREFCHANHVLWTRGRAEPYGMTIIPLEWRAARVMFLNRFEELTRKAA